MNVNTESYFSQLPQADIQRSILDLSHGNKFSGNCADLIPFDLIEVLPGDTLKVTTSKVVRFQTMLTPVMDNAWLDVYWFYVPNRLVFDRWAELCGENTASPWIPSTSYSLPTISSPSGGFALNTIADYFHCPVGVQWSASDLNAPHVLPFRGYALIANEFFRDQNVTNPLNIPKGTSNQNGTNGSSYVNDVANGGACFKVAKAHDYFTSCLPAPQKGPNVSFNLINGNQAPVYTGGNHFGAVFPNEQKSFKFAEASGIPSVGHHKFDVYFDGVGQASGLGMVENSSETVGTTSGVYPVNLWADLSSSLGSVTINELRLAFQLQKFYEKQALAGSRLTETIREMFGVVSPDARLQRPEYLGGNRTPIQIHQVSNTAQTSTDFLGDVGAYSLTADVNYDFEKSFTEHGYVFGLCCVRYSHSYSQGMPKHFLRRNFTDFYLPVFANLGNTGVRDAQIYFDANSKNSDSVFGYQECWAEYRYLPDSVAGEMRPGVVNTLASWHYGDYYTSKPTLSDGWIREDPTNIDRTLASGMVNNNQFFADFEIKCIATRPMPVYSIPGLIDHH